MPEDVSRLTARDLLTQDFVRVEGQQTVSVLLAALKKAQSPHALVFQGKKILGAAYESDLLRNVDISKTNISTIARTTPSVSPADKLEKMVRLMRDGDVRVLPVIDKGLVIGVVEARALLSRLQNHSAFESVSAKELVSSNPVSVMAEDSLALAIRKMKDSNVRKLIVMGPQRKPVGVLRVEGIATDVLLSLKRGGKNEYKPKSGSRSISSGPAFDIKVKSVMDDQVSFVLPGEKGKSVVKKLAAQANPVLLVVDNGMVGLISVQSVLDTYLSTKSAPVASPIVITHLPDIDEIDRANVEQILQRTYDKASRILKTQNPMHVVFKQSKKSGLRAQTHVAITLSGVVGRVLHSEATDWKVLLATKEACNSLEAEIAKRFKRR